MRRAWSGGSSGRSCILSSCGRTENKSANCGTDISPRIVRARSVRRFEMICRWARGSASMSVSAAFSESSTEKTACCSSSESSSRASARSSLGSSWICDRVTLSETRSVAVTSSSESGCTYFQEMNTSFKQVEAAQAPAPQEAVEGNIDVHQHHAALRLQQVDVVDHLGPPAVHVQDRLAHQVLVEHQPAGLVDEGRILVAAFRRLDEDGVGIDLDQAVEGNELGRLAPAMFEVQADRFGIRLAEPEDDVRQFAQAVVDVALAHRAGPPTAKNSGSGSLSRRPSRTGEPAAGLDGVDMAAPCDPSQPKRTETP